MPERRGWEFRVLGPLEVWRGGPAIALSAPKQRVLLAALILRANRVVSSDTLVELLWGDDPPATARNTLHSLVRRLRRLLAAKDVGVTLGEGRILVTHSCGYSLRIEEPDNSDLSQFETLAAEGHRLAKRAPDRAATLLQAALSLWRGSPLADVDSEWLQRVEIPRLEEQRLAALEDRITADMVCGRHAELVGELQALVAAHPLRPRLLGQLMLALHRSGRQAHALAAYRAARDTMMRELGLEPSSELRRLQQSIITADSSLDMEEPSTTLAVLRGTGLKREPPRQLPPDTAVFVGRGDELSRLAELLTPHRSADQPATVVVNGGPGVGKSTLAIHAAHQLSEYFTDGQLYADLHTSEGSSVAVPTLQILAQFLHAMGLPGAHVPHTLEEASAAFRSLTADKRLLVVLDNARAPEQVLRLLPAGPGCAALVTSQQAIISRENAPHLHLGVLPMTEAIALLRQMVGPQRIDSEPEATTVLANLCARLPLALRIAAERLVMRPSWPVGALVKRLTEPHRRLDELALGGVAIRTSLQVSYEALPADHARVFQLLGLLNQAEVSVETLPALLRQHPEAVETALEHLVDFALLESPAPGRYAMNELARPFAREKAVQAGTLITR